MKAFLSSILSFSLLISAGGMSSAAGAAQGSRPSTPARASTTQQPADGGWPRAYITTPGARLVIHEPQIASWLDQKRVAMYAAVSSAPADQNSTALGTIRVEAVGSPATSFLRADNPSHGHGARYSAWLGAYARRGAVYGPCGGAEYAVRYNPRTGTDARGAAAWGPGGARGAAQAWNPRNCTSAQTRQGANVFGSWGASGMQRGGR
jgi:hypothetical protein